MKRIFTLLALATIVLSSCRSVDKYTQRGNYDAAIDLAIKKLNKRKELKTKDVRAMEYAFSRIKSKEEHDIRSKYSSRRSDWSSVYTDIINIDRLQKRVKPYLPIISKDGYRAKISFINIGKLQEVALYEANQRDLKEIASLSGAEEHALKIYRLYARIADRQEYLMGRAPIIGVEGYRPEFRYADVTTKMYAAKEQAVRIEYDKGMAYMKQAEGTKDKYAARKAYEIFRKVNGMQPDYKSTVMYMRKARDLGIVHVLVELNNRSMTIIPRQLQQYIINTDFRDLNDQWTRFYNDKRDRSDFDVLAGVEILDLDISPEREDAHTHTYSKEVVDGWEYVYDDRGNVKKDSSGNDIKVDRYALINGDYTTIKRTKFSTITGAVSYVNRNTGQKLHSRPLNVDFGFEDEAYFFRGDDRVLTDEMKNALRKRPARFPTDMDMTMSSGEVLRNELRKELAKMIFRNNWFA